MKGHASSPYGYGKLIGVVAGIVLLRANPLLGALLGLWIGQAADAGWLARRSDNPYRVFGLTDAASDAEVDLARRRLIARHHPDRAVGDEPRRHAEHRAREINAAYDRIRTLRQDPRRPNTSRPRTRPQRKPPQRKD